MGNNCAILLFLQWKENEIGVRFVSSKCRFFFFFFSETRRIITTSPGISSITIRLD